MDNNKSEKKTPMINCSWNRCKWWQAAKELTEGLKHSPRKKGCKACQRLSYYGKNT